MSIYTHGPRRPIIGYVPGGFDMLHVGHLNILREARKHCDYLIVGVATDQSLLNMKGRLPIIPFDARLELVEALEIVDLAVADTSQNKLHAWAKHHFDVLFKGDDWKGTAKGEQLEAEMDTVGAKVHYMPYTPGVSSSQLRQRLEPLLAS